MIANTATMAEARAHEARVRRAATEPRYLYRVQPRGNNTRFNGQRLRPGADGWCEVEVFASDVARLESMVESETEMLAAAQRSLAGELERRDAAWRREHGHKSEPPRTLRDNVEAHFRLLTGRGLRPLIAVERVRELPLGRVEDPGQDALNRIVELLTDGAKRGPGRPRKAAD